MESLNRRTNANSGVAFEYSDSVLAVGARTAVLDDVSDRSEVLRTYFDLVAEQRNAPLSSRIDLRDRDLVSLASILDLPAVELERYIDRELARFVQATTAGDRPAVLATIGPPGVRKVRISLLVVGAAALAAGAATVVAHLTASAQPAPAAPAVVAPVADPGAGTARVETDPNGTGTFVIVDSPAVPAAADGTEIGSARQVTPQP